MANNFFVSYDLISPGQRYDKVTATVQALGAWAKVEYSLYYVKSNLTVEQAGFLAVREQRAEGGVDVPDSTFLGAASWVLNS